MAKVREDKERESSDGFDGTWVAHPDLVPLATSVFDDVLGARPNQKEARLGERFDDAADLAALLDFGVPGGLRTEAGVRANVSVALAYLASWLGGNGAAAINNLMEDAATAEIARSQLWLWHSRRDTLDDGRPIDDALYRRLRDDELARLAEAVPDASRLADAAALLDDLVLAPDFVEFLTLPAYGLLP
jgi:malate synthase